MTDNPVNLVCLPYAGGVAGSYRRWQRALGSGIAVRTIDYPGRGSRRAEPAAVDYRDVVADVVERVSEFDGSSVVFFGHSMGGWVAYEAVRALEAAGQSPAGLIVSAVAAPEFIAERPTSGEVTDDALRDKCVQWGGTPAELLDDPAFREPLFRHLRADLKTIDSYVPNLDSQVRAPMIGLAGRADTTAPSRRVARWAAHAEDWRGVTVAPGGHFFTTTAEDLVVRIIAQHCRAVSTDRSGASRPSTPTPTASF